MKPNPKSGFALLPALVAAIFIAVALVKSSEPLQHVAAEMPSRAVEVIGARRVTLPYRRAMFR